MSDIEDARLTRRRLVAVVTRSTQLSHILVLSDRLWTGLIQHGVFTEQERRHIINSSTHEDRRVLELLNMLAHRVGDHYNSFIRVLQEDEQYEAIRILQPDVAEQDQPALSPTLLLSPSAHMTDPEVVSVAPQQELVQSETRRTITPKHLERCQANQTSQPTSGIGEVQPKSVLKTSAHYPVIKKPLTTIGASSNNANSDTAHKLRNQSRPGRKMEKQQPLTPTEREGPSSLTDIPSAGLYNPRKVTFQGQPNKSKSWQNLTPHNDPEKSVGKPFIPSERRFDFPPRKLPPLIATGAGYVQLKSDSSTRLHIAEVPPISPQGTTRRNENVVTSAVEDNVCQDATGPQSCDSRNTCSPSPQGTERKHESGFPVKTAWQNIKEPRPLDTGDSDQTSPHGYHGNDSSFHSAEDKNALQMTKEPGSSDTINVSPQAQQVTDRKDGTKPSPVKDNQKLQTRNSGDLVSVTLGSPEPFRPSQHGGVVTEKTDTSTSLERETPDACTSRATESSESHLNVLDPADFCSKPVPEPQNTDATRDNVPNSVSSKVNAMPLDESSLPPEIPSVSDEEMFRHLAERFGDIYSMLDLSTCHNGHASVPFYTLYTEPVLKSVIGDDEETQTFEGDHLLQNLSSKKWRDVLLVGKPGIGKSTFAKSMALQWARSVQENTNKNVITNKLGFRFVVLLDLQLVRNGATLVSVLLDQLSVSLDQATKLAGYIQSGCQDVLLILDGLESTVEGASYDTTGFIQTLPTKCCKVITARSQLVAERYFASLTFDKCIEINGFTKRRTRDYISKCLKALQGNMHLESEANLITEIENTENLLPLSTYPLHLTFLCSFWLKCKPLFKDIGSLYLALVDHSARHYLKAKSREVCQGRPRQCLMECVPELIQVGQWARRMIMHGDEELPLEESDETLRLLRTNLPIVTLSESKCDRLTVSFVSKYMGIFLGALHVILSGDQDAMRQILLTIDHKERQKDAQVLLALVCKLSHIVDNKHNENLCEVIMQWLTQEEHFNTRLQALQSLKTPLPTFEFKDLKISVTEDLQRVIFGAEPSDIRNLENCSKSFRDYIAKLLLRRANYPLDDISRNISLHNTTMPHCSLFLHVFSHIQTLESLCLDHIHSYPEPILCLSKAITKFKSLKILKINNCQINDHEERDSLVSSLRALTFLVVLHIIDTALGPENITEIGSLCVHLRWLKILKLRNVQPRQSTGQNVGDNHKSCDKTKNNEETAWLSLVNNLKSIPSLEVLDIGGNDLCGPVILAVGDLLLHLQNLRILALEDCRCPDEEACAVLVASLKAVPTLQYLCLSGNNLGMDGVRKLCQVLPLLDRLRHLDISQCRCYDPDTIDELVQELKHAQKIEKLDISQNTIGSKGIENLADLVQQNQNIKALQLQYCDHDSHESVTSFVRTMKTMGQLETFDGEGLSVENATLSALVDAVPHWKNVQWLNLKGWNCTDHSVTESLAKALSTATTLTGLILGGNRFNGAGFIELSKALSNMTLLQDLSLENCNCRDPGAVSILVPVLQSKSKLQRLDLSGNTASAEGFISLSRSLRSLKELKELNISDCECFDESATESLVKGLRKCTNLEVIDMSSNTFGIRGLTAITDVVRWLPKLRRIILKDCYCENMDLVSKFIENLKLRDMEVLELNGMHGGSPGIRAVSKALTGWHGLRWLNLNGWNCADSSLMASMIKALTKHHSLEGLMLNGNKLGSEGFAGLAQVLPSCNNLHILSLQDCQCDGGPAYAQVMTKLRHATGLKQLLLSGNHCGESGISSLAQTVPHLVKLEHLDISDNGCKSPEQTRLLAQNLVHLSETLCVLDLSNTLLDSQGFTDLVESVQTMNNLEKLVMRHCPCVDLTTIAPLVHSLKDKKQMTVFDLEGLPGGTDGVQALMDVIPQWSGLQWFNIGEWQCTDVASMEQLVKLLVHCTSLECLVLSGNSLQKTGAKALIEVLPSLTNLRQIWCVNCENDDEESGLLLEQTIERVTAV